MADYGLLGPSQVCRAFDDCDLAYFHTEMLLRDEELLQRQAQQTNDNTGFVLAAVTDAGTSRTGHLQRPCPNTNHEQTLLPSDDFVSAYVVIDPSQPDQILVPQQLLTYTSPGATEPQTISWGPVVLPSSLLDTSVSSTVTKQEIQHRQAATLPASPYQEFSGLVDASLDKIVSGSEPNDELLHTPAALNYAKKIGKGQSLSSKIVTPPTHKKTGGSKRRRKSDTDSEGGRHGKPRLLKPLTAYNFYYRDERDNIVLATTGDPIPPPVSDFSEAKSQKLLADRWLKDPTKEKRKHRRTHGKMEFAE